MCLFLSLFFRGWTQIKPSEIESENSYYYYYLTRANGLPSDRVKAVLQDFRGFVWIATSNGLARYDGLNIEVFQHKANDTNTIVDNLLYSLYESKDSLLWIGGIDGLSIYNPFIGAFTNYSYYASDNKKFPAKGVICFFEDNDGSMWLGTENGLVHMLFHPLRIECFPLKENNDPSNHTWSFKHIDVILADPRDDSKLLLGTLGGLIQFDKKSKSISRDYSKGYLGNYDIISALLLYNRYLWTCGWGTGLNCFDLESETWKEYPFNNKKPLDILGITPKSPDELWLATTDMGLGVFNMKKETFSFHPKDVLNPNSLLSNITLSIKYINKTGIWIPSDDGINILNSDFRSFKKISFPFNVAGISTFYRDSLNDNFYVGASEGNGIYQWKENDNTWKTILPDIHFDKNTFSVHKIYMDSKHKIWVSTSQNLFFLNEKNNGLELYKTEEGKPIPSAENWMSGLFEDSRGFLWVGTRDEGVWKLDPDRKNVTHYINSENNNESLINGCYFSAIKEDCYGNIWIGSNAGISIYSPVRNAFYNDLMNILVKWGVTKHWVNGIEKGKDGNMWLSVDGEGLVKIDISNPASLRIRLFNTMNGLNDLAMGRLAQDPLGDFWLVNYGLIHLNPNNESVHIINQFNGLHEKINVYEPLYIDYLGNIYIGGNNAFEIKNIHDINFNSRPVSIVMDYLEVNGKRQGIGYSPVSDVLFNLKSDENNLLFKFSVICFENSDRLTIRYKLEGFDEEWILAGDRREARYTNLPPGDYRFVVQISNSGKGLQKESAIGLNIPLVFYRTWWFILIVVVCVALIVFAILRNRINHLLKVERIRNRIARDLHDDIGSTLSSISIMSDLLSQAHVDADSEKKIGIIGNTADQMLEKMDDIIWTVNPSNDTFSNLELRIREFAIPLLELKDIHFEIHFDKNLSGQTLQMEKRRDLYLIAKEAINNLVKYSKCKSCQILFFSDNSGFCMKITDDGEGFDTEIITNRNGLRNMQQRAKNIDANIQITSSKGKGTQILLCLKTI
jgi:ligand-binding sensor domain-containing protein